MEEVYDKESIVLYIDLLGFKAKILEVERDKDAQKWDQIVNFLESVSTLIGTSPLHVQDDQTFTKTTYPNFRYISIFSDSIVVSYPLYSGSNNGNEGIHPAGYMWSIMCDLRWFVFNLSFPAMQLGLPIRGGLAIGKLYHNPSKIIVGPALIEAHFLESEIAEYPRIVVSNKLIEFFKRDNDWVLRSNFITEDGCGMYYLDYLNLEYEIKKPNFPNEVVEKCFEESLKNIEKNINKFKNRDVELKLFAKWKWIEQYIHRSLIKNGYKENIILESKS